MDEKSKVNIFTSFITVYLHSSQVTSWNWRLNYTVPHCFQPRSISVPAMLTKYLLDEKAQYVSG